MPSSTHAFFDSCLLRLMPSSAHAFLIAKFSISWVTTRIARRIPGATLHVIEDAGHLPQVEQPEQFVRILRSILDAQ
ncbi:MAG: alpha/beta fold hydrolase [Myxococcales bacterium]